MRKERGSHSTRIKSRSEDGYERETETAEERQAVADADEWLKHNTRIPFEDVLADFGLTLEDVKNYKEPK